MHRTARDVRAARSAARLLLLAVAALLAAPVPAWAREPARITELTGQVEVGIGDPPQFRPARAGEELPEDAVLRTGSDGRAEVEYGDDTLRLYGDTLLRLAPAADRTRVELERGKSLFDVRPGRTRGFEVRTREVAVMVKGTRFLVDAEAAHVSVFRGLVGVADLAGGSDDVDVHAGLSLARAAAGGAFELHVTPFADPWDAWSTQEREVLHELPQRSEPRREALGELRQALAESDPRERIETLEQVEPEKLDPVLDVPRELERVEPVKEELRARQSRDEDDPIRALVGGGQSGQDTGSQGLVGSLIDDVLDGGGLGGGDDDDGDDDDGDDDDGDDDDGDDGDD
jgi:hypothetical protein